MKAAVKAAVAAAFGIWFVALFFLKDLCRSGNHVLRRCRRIGSTLIRVGCSDRPGVMFTDAV